MRMTTFNTSRMTTFNTNYLILKTENFVDGYLMELKPVKDLIASGIDQSTVIINLMAANEQDQTLLIEIIWGDTNNRSIQHSKLVIMKPNPSKIQLPLDDGDGNSYIVTDGLIGSPNQTGTRE